jgi:hypothetical protein
VSNGIFEAHVTYWPEQAFTALRILDNPLWLGPITVAVVLAWAISVKFGAHRTSAWVWIAGAVIYGWQGRWGSKLHP